MRQPAHRLSTSRNPGRVSGAVCVPALAMAAVATLAAATQARPTLDYPLSVGTRWTYHFHQENGPGVTVDYPDLAKIAKGNVVDTTVVALVAGTDAIGSHTYSRIETRLNEKPLLIEWERIAPEGLLVGQTLDYQMGPDKMIMLPEQRRISATLRPGDFWYWQPRSGGMRMRYNVVGPGAVDVPAGHYQGVHLTADGTIKAGAGDVEIAAHQDTWFVPHVGIVRQESTEALGQRHLTDIMLELQEYRAS